MADFLRERYGRTTFVARQRVAVAVGAVVALAAIAFIYRVSTAPTVRFELSAFEVVDEATVSVSWQVSRAADTTSYCVVRAQNDKRQDVGYATVTVAAGPARVHMTYHLATESAAVLAEVLACSDQPTMRAPRPDFPPGVIPPQQAAPGVAPTS